MHSGRGEKGREAEGRKGEGRGVAKIWCKIFKLNRENCQVSSS
jgi:hypothetical protein